MCSADLTRVGAAAGILFVLPAPGHCHETLGSPPFWPWLQILKGLEAAEDLIDDLTELESLGS